MKLFRRKAEPPVFEPVRELSGIEKMALEAEYKRTIDRLQAEAERRAALEARIVEIEKEIEPQLEELRRLKATLYPYQEYLNAPPGTILRGSNEVWNVTMWPGMLGGLGRLA